MYAIRQKYFFVYSVSIGIVELRIPLSLDLLNGIIFCRLEMRCAA